MLYKWPVPLKGWYRCRDFKSSWSWWNCVNLASGKNEVLLAFPGNLTRNSPGSGWRVHPIAIPNRWTVFELQFLSPEQAHSDLK